MDRQNDSVSLFGFLTETREVKVWHLMGYAIALVLLFILPRLA